MPRYFLHIQDPNGLCPDADGYDAPDLATACELARRAAAEMVADDLRNADATAFAIHVDDEAGARVAVINVAASLGASSIPSA